jgi:hypothetical protein
MAVRTATFAYPWDLGRLGVGRTLERIAAQGFDAVYLAATYHPIDALSPRDGRARLFTSARGAVHFPARPERYGRIAPAVSSPEITAVWPEAASRARDLGVALIPWTILLYQPWIVDAHPDCARVLPGGDAIGAGVCPANDDVREYVLALCDDVVDQFGVETVHLEGAAAASFDYGWLRPRIMVDLSERARELLALCFCPSCRRRGRDEGLDVDRLEATVGEAIAAELGDEPRNAAGPERESEATEIRAFAELAVRASIELVEGVRASVQGPSAPRLSGMPWTPFSTILGDRDDACFEESLRPFDQVMVSPRATDHRTEVAMASRASGELELGVLLTPRRVADDARGAAAIGASEVALYNYGLLRDADVQRMTASISAAFGRQ